MKSIPALVLLIVSLSNTSHPLPQVVLTGAIVGSPAEPQKIVTAAQANGIYRYRDNEIRILALGHNKLRIQLELTYAFKSQYGPMANTGEADGEATIQNDTAIFHPTEGCAITIKFLAGNKIKVTQDHDAADCGFGNHVFADGTYRKIKGGKPKFEKVSSFKFQVSSSGAQT